MLLALILVWLIDSYTEDYRAGPYCATFSSGHTYDTINIPITDDNVVEDIESFILTVDTISLPTGISFDSYPHTTVTISDDDGKWVIALVDRYAVTLGILWFNHSGVAII